MNRQLKGLVSLFLFVFAMQILVTGCGRQRSSELPPPTNLPEGETTAVSVFYPNGKIIIEERRVFPVTDNMPEAALKELFKAEPEESKIAVVLPKAKVLSVKVDKDGLATIDFSREILDFPEDSRDAKIAAFAAIIETLKQFENIKKFRITVEGKEEGKIGSKSIEEFWGDISLKKQPFNIIRKTAETTETTS